MALKAGYKGIKKIGTGLKLTTEGTLSLDGSVNLDDLGDVVITDPANEDILVYDSTDEEWKNAAPTSAADKADIIAIGTNETGDTASKAYAIGEHFYKNGKFCTAIASIAQGATFTLNTNYIEGTIADLLKPQYELLVSTSAVSWVQETVNNLNLYRYIRLAIHAAAGGEINSNLIPMDLFKTFVSDQAPAGVVSNENGVKYGLAFYISNTSIKVYSSGNVFKIYGIK